MSPSELGVFGIYGLVQERHNSSALAMELRLSCMNPSQWYVLMLCHSLLMLFDYQVLQYKKRVGELEEEGKQQKAKVHHVTSHMICLHDNSHQSDFDVFVSTLY